MQRVGTVDVVGVKVGVVKTTTEEAGDENLMSDEVNATYDQDAQLVRLNEASCGEPTASKFYACHEVLHAWFANTGARYYLRNLLRMTVAEFDLVEENVIRMFTPAMLSSHEGLSQVFKALDATPGDQ